MGRWRWLNLALLLVATSYAGLFLAGRTEGAFSGKAAEDWRLLPAARDNSADARLYLHKDGRRLRLRLGKEAWRNLNTACLPGPAAPCFDGERHAFDLEVPVGTSGDPLVIRLRNWSGEERLLRYRSAGS